MSTMTERDDIRVIELFAGVGGFRLGLEGHPKQAERRRWPNHGFRVVWSNQWEPPGTLARQFAFRCYSSHFGATDETLPPENEDIAIVNEGLKAGRYRLPDYDMLCGGFPCQDYSVAKPLPQASGIEGKKGVLWWQIHERISADLPRYVLLENVDRLLKSPAVQRGRDFAVILACFAHLGYLVEWRVVNAADYGFPQRRRRVFIFAQRVDQESGGHLEERLLDRLLRSGVLAGALPIRERGLVDVDAAGLDRFLLRRNLDDLANPHFPYFVSKEYGLPGSSGPFQSAGIMYGGQGLHGNLSPDASGLRRRTLGDVVRRTRRVDSSYFVDPATLDKWAYQKGSKKERRTHRSGFEYFYSEGAMTFPDALDRPSRTILTGEGGASASRFKHIVDSGDGRLRRLTPEELEDLNGFPRGWTSDGMSPAQRAFCMGNALVVGVVQRIAVSLQEHNHSK